ncbi:TolC family protein [Oceanospirillum sanctuarii]|uniref:TolC family protein n=1 Tax=Oceanospirillum sanctuarii TaxID=1434821 RepID=UPI0015949BC8|nr:TolC family protein [Oceanospirillum sanctuarii]
MIVRNFLLIFFLVLAGCASAPDELSDDIVAVPELADDVSSVTNDAPFANKNPVIHVPDDESFNLWWRYTGNNELELLIDRALTNSQTLQIAAQQIVQAKALAVQAGAAGSPSVTAQASYSEEAPTAGIGSVPRGSTAQSQGEYEVGLIGRYQLDLWGQNASLAQSGELKLKRAIFQYDAQRLELISQLAKSYFEYLSLNDRIRNTRETEEALTSMLLAMQDRYDQGDATVVEMQIQRSAIFSSRVRLPTLLKDRQQLEFAIARLVGVAPGQLKLTDKGLSTVAMPDAVRGLSTAYLLRRPDIRAIESGMLAADADLDVARKALLPGLTLSAGISSGVRNPADLFQPNTLLWNALGTLSASVFDGGAGEQNVKFAQAVRNELVESYANTVYNGLSAARTAITELEFSGERLSMQQESAEAAKVAQDFGFESYSVGGIDFLTYLDSMQSYQERMDVLHQFELEYYQAFVDFYASLGGGIPYRSISETSPVFKAGTDRSTDSVKVLPAATVSTRSYVVDGWMDEPENFTSSPWMVKLMGVYDHFAVDALVRDLPRRYESLEPAKEILIEVVDVNLVGAEADTHWYSVNFTGFLSEQEAQRWCTQMRNQQQRCVVYQPEENFDVIARFDIPAMEKRAYYAGESYLARRHRAEQQAKTSENKTVDGMKYGQLYSLIKIEGRYAWLIGNRSHTVRRFPVGASLAYKGKLKSVNRNRAIISFEHRDYLLRPLYLVEAVEEGSGKQRFARMRWGGKSGEVYYHRLGERLYGGGVIKAINDKDVVVEWKGQRVSLPVRN